MARSLVGTLHTNSVVTATVSAAATSILGIEDFSVDPKIQDEINHAGGDWRPSHIVMMHGSPEVGWSCNDCANALAFIPHLTGRRITGGTDTLDFFFAKKATATHGSVRLSGSVHTRYRAMDSLTVLEELSASQGQKATAKFRTVTIYDGTNIPLVPAGSVALTSSISNLTEMFKLGKWDASGSNIDGVIAASYKPGIEVKVDHAGGETWPSAVTITKVAPTVELTTLEIPYFTTLTVDGAKGTTSIAGYFYKLDEFGAQLADATAEHIKLTCIANHFRISPGAISVKNNDNGTFTTTLRFAHDGTSDPITLSTASAVT